MLKAGELRELSIQEIKEKEKELGRSLFNLRFQRATGQQSDHTAFNKAKKDMARIKTVLREMANKENTPE